MDYNIWYSARWKKHEENFEQKGLRICYISKINDNDKTECKKFVRFLRKEYEFPFRVRICIKLCRDISQSSMVYKVIENIRFNIEIKVCKNISKIESEIKKQIVHGLTYYFLYINHMHYNKMDLVLNDYEKRILNDYDMIKNDTGKYKWHLWTLYNWEKFIYLDDYEYHNNGLRMKIDKGIDVDLRKVCKKFAIYLRKEYEFPIRVNIHVKNTNKIRAMDNDYVYGLLCYDDFSIEPDIWVAAGDFSVLKENYGYVNAVISILRTIAHELTHYYQWINQIQFTSIGLERQANEYAENVVEDFVEDLQKREIDIENM